MESKKTAKIITLLISLIIAIIIGVFFESLNSFFSFLLIEFWILFTIKFFKKKKRLDDYNSPHNTSFFILVPMIIGLFYSFWGHFTTFFGENLLEGQNTIIIFSFWGFVFAFPYLLYGLNSIYSCYNKKKFNIVYLYKNKSIDARKFAFLWTFCVLLIIISFWIFFYFVLDFNLLPLNPLHSYIDLILLIIFIITWCLLIITGFIGKGSSYPLSIDYITSRRQAINRLSTPPRTRTSYSQRTRTTSRAKPRGQQVSRTTKTKATKREKKVKTTTVKGRSAQARGKKGLKKLISTAVFDRFKPKAGVITLEDFKCIFCFKLPNLSEDRNRGVILCPNCRYPAHADEFKGWLKSSALCSRCDTAIPASFMRNPKVISTASYVKVIQKFRSRKR